MLAAESSTSGTGSAGGRDGSSATETGSGITGEGNGAPPGGGNGIPGIGGSGAGGSVGLGNWFEPFFLPLRKPMSLTLDRVESGRVLNLTERRTLKNSNLTTKKIIQFIILAHPFRTRNVAPVS